MDLAPDDKPIKTTWMQLKGQPLLQKKPYIMHNERQTREKANQAATNKARGGQRTLVHGKEGSLQKVAKIKRKECEHEEESI